VTGVLYIPIEIASREFDAKLLLGLVAAERGMSVVLGRRLEVDSPRFSPGVYMAKNVRGGFILDKPAAFGHAVVAQDEEGLVRFPDHVQAMRLETRALTVPRLLYAWGRDNADHWRALPTYDGRPIVEAGNPRADLLRPELRAIHAPAVAALSAEYGPFVLLNTNFSIVNHFQSGHTSFRRAADADAATFQRIWEGVSAHKRALLRHFLDLIAPLARAIAPARLVIRPHPSEDQSAWQAAASGHANVVVATKGGVVPWLLASSGLVQNGCTTAIEAAMLDVPTVTFRPVASPDYDLPLPNRFGVAAATADDAAAAARAMIDDPAAVLEPRAARLSRLEPFIASATGALSCERIVDGFARHREILDTRQPAALATHAMAWGQVALDAISDRMWDKRYNRHIFPPMSPETAAEAVARYRRALGRFGGVKLSALSPSLFRLDPG
jgi:surface carbohydrate biosynthesis protein